jgi:hypothetical protein
MSFRDALASALAGGVIDDLKKLLIESSTMNLQAFVARM